MKLISYALTDVGRFRDHNEDSFLQRDDLGLYGVADGMGGHTAGEQASRLAVTAVEAALSATTASERQALVAAVGQATKTASAEIFSAGERNPDLEGMGTTLTVLWFRGGRVYLSHVGDSRAYLYRDGAVKQLSLDHTWVNEQVRSGQMTEAEAKGSQYRHVITRSVGFERNVEVDTLAQTVEAGDLYLLCSDGLSNYFSEEILADVFAQTFYRNLPSRLVDLANTCGGEDNITALVVQVCNDTGST